MKSFQLTARSLRYILLTTLLLLLVGGGAGFFFLHKQMQVYADETSQLNSQVANSARTVEILNGIREYLENHQSDISRASKVVSESKQYQYQPEIVDAITDLANQSDVQVLSYTFADVAPTTPAPAAGTAPSNDPGATPVPGATAPTGLNSRTVDVSIKNPVSYEKLLKFVYLIEQNITRMQIASISLSKATETEGGSNNQVSTSAFNIEVYVR